MKLTTAFEPTRFRGHESTLLPGYYRGTVRGHQDILFGIIGYRVGTSPRQIVFFNDVEPGLMPVMTDPKGPDKVDCVAVSIEEVLLNLRQA